MKQYLKTDSYRMITSWQFYAGVLGVAVVYLIGGFQFGESAVTDVYISYFYNSWFGTVIITYAFCAVPFSGSFIEDGENGFWTLSMQKGSLHHYVWSKVVTCFLSGIVTMASGVMLYAFLLRMKVPFYQEHTFLDSQRRVDSFGSLLYEETILLYFLATAVLGGILGGIFSLLSAFLSLFERSRLLTISLPVVSFYFIQNFLTGNLGLPDCFNIWAIYGQGFMLFENSCLHMLYAVFIAVCFVVGIGHLTEKKLWREIYGIKDGAGFKNPCRKFKK